MTGAWIILGVLWVAIIVGAAWLVRLLWRRTAWPGETRHTVKPKAGRFVERIGDGEDEE